MPDRHEVPPEGLEKVFEDALHELPLDSQKDVLVWLPEELTAIPARAHEADVRRVDGDLLGSGNWYAVHDSEIDLLKESVAVVLAALGGKSLGAIGSLVVLLFKYRKKRVLLQADQGIVLRALKRAEGRGASVESLAADLPHMKAADIQSTLTQLSSVARTDGTVTALAACRDGRWFAVDV